MGVTHFSGLAVSSAAAPSTHSIGTINRYLVEFTPPTYTASTTASNSTPISTHTVTGLTTNSALFFTPTAALSSGYGIGAVTCSTADELKIQWVFSKNNDTSGSTNRGWLIEFKV